MNPTSYSPILTQYAAVWRLYCEHNILNLANCDLPNSMALCNRKSMDSNLILPHPCPMYRLNHR
ncbi:hypothetical protein CY34DRAFT_569640 [Suillus luteus UH-Slu-Lm8-n1]|uniref:Unplaced genomic scaffold CY34scaffold_484, whole genome shotgun sequence n=1 Tax=Suillus luteus UH-Slu-Lm8-n1 TaxID=930992 RepID=A0A0C9ZDG7_9AGAM|nr:hypothetical protein CY34DRAFT_569640 [Suillus luteus UH-Slu-Lm8-n1]